jgi:small subunit ribosomal protein S24e
MADIEIVQKRENVLLKRTEVTFRLTHSKEKTPQRDAVRDKLAAHVGGKKEGIIVDFLRSKFGSPVTFGYAKVYESAEAAKKIEPPFLLIRHGLAEKKKPGAEAAKPAAKAPEKKK